MACDECTSLLHEALNLTVRGRRLDAIQNRASCLAASVAAEEWQKSGQFDRYVERHNARCEPWRYIEPRSLTPQLWVEEQFERDLHEWEQRARKHMTEAHP